jgi:hypothetical protein
MTDKATIRQRALRTRFLVVLSLLSVATWLAMCVFINPPFTTVGPFNRSDINTGTTDALAGLLLLWFIGGGIALRSLRTPNLIVRVLSSLMLGLPLGVLALALIFFFKAHGASVEVIKHFWLGQAVGTLGVAWLLVIGQLWIKMERPQPATPPYSEPATRSPQG